MPTKDPKPPETPHADPDPEHPVEYGGDLEQDDPDTQDEGGRKGGHPLDPEERKRGIRDTPRE